MNGQTLSPIAATPKPPYYAVIFTSKRTDVERLGITVSYWESLEAISAWKQNSAHLIAQQQGRNLWYDSYMTRICRVERDYAFSNGA